MPPHAAVEQAGGGGEYSCWGPGKQVQESSVKYCEGAIVVGAGPAGLATAACLQAQGVGALVLEKAACIASLWQLKTYDRLHLHLPKQFCELPLFPFPADFPTYPARHQFVRYLQDYAAHFALAPLFNHAVHHAEFDARSALWHVKTTTTTTSTTTGCGAREFRARWLVVASGENADPVVPAFPGAAAFHGPLFHSSAYRNGVAFHGQNVLVVGCGNTGMEIALDLANFGASPSLVVRSPVSYLIPKLAFVKHKPGCGFGFLGLKQAKLRGLVFWCD
jgi:indole-3-pyruvate monooxygenase